MWRLNRWKVWVNSSWMTRGEPSVCTKDLDFTLKVELISIIHLGREIRDVRARRDFLDSKRKKKIHDRLRRGNNRQTQCSRRTRSRQ